MIWFCAVALSHWGFYTSVSPSRGFICLFGALFTLILASIPVAAGQNRPILRLLLLSPASGPIRPSIPTGVDDAAVPVLTTPAARSITAGFIGRPIDDTLLARIRGRLQAYYVHLDRPFVDIAIPVQDVAGGILRVNVIETKIGRITVTGNRWFDNQQYTGAIRSRPGGPIDIRTLTDDTGWLNRNNARHVTISIRPTDTPAVYDLAINAKDRLPLRVTLAADNTGSGDTGLYRTGIGLDWTNAFWRGDDLRYGFITDPQGFRLVQHALSDTFDLPWRDTMTIAAVTAATRGALLGTSNAYSVNGRADIFSWRYALAIPAAPAWVQHLELGYDFKSANTNILSGGTVVFPSAAELNQFSADYEVRRADALGLTGLTAMLVGSPGYLTPHNTAAALAAQQPGASPSYIYGRISLERLTDLPLDTHWYAKITAQFSSGNLLPSEQLAFGGVQSVRGFVEFGATRDIGVLLRNEWRLAPLKTGLFRTAGHADALEPFLFLDLGAGRDHSNMANVQRSWIELVSAGPGLTWRINRTAAIRLSWGFPLVRNGHTSPFLGPQFGTRITF